MAKRMSTDELRAITDSEMRNAVGYWSGKLANQRQKALIYYLGLPKHDLTPPEIEGRSQVVSPDVRNTIESMLPQLMVKFAGSEHPVEFEPVKPGDEQKAQQATDYINHLYHVKNDGERITYNWMKDALLSKNGIIKVWWDTRQEEKREEYIGLTDVELAQLVDDDEIEITEQKSYPDEEDAEQRAEALEQIGQQMQRAMQAAQMGDPQAQQAVMQMQEQSARIQSMPPKMLFDVTCKRVMSGGCVKVENVPPEEFLISRKAKSIEDAPFVGHRVSRTISELKSMGYKNVDGIAGDEQAAALNLERVERQAWDDEMAYTGSDLQITADESQRSVWVTECYVRVDFDGDGIAELRKVVRAGNQVLENEIIDCSPFVSITPVPLPHKFFGLSVADLSMEAQKIKTSILRGMLDNMYLQINGRYFAVDGQVNLDDLLTSRPGGVVRVKQPGMAGRLDQGMGDSQLGMSMMEYMHQFLEDSSGWSRNSAGNDPSSLSDPITATQAQIVTNKADMRLDLIARNFAAGFRDLFRMMLKLVSQYNTKQDVIRLRGEWVAINPREWTHGFDVSINVGLGTGDRAQQIGQLNALMQNMVLSMQGGLGTVTPQNFYEAQKELVKALGYKSPDKFVSDPSKQPPKQPPPDPEQIKGQITLQVEQMKAQLKAQSDKEKAELQAQVEMAKQEAQQAQVEAESRIEAEKAAFEAQLAQVEADKQREFEMWKAEMDARVKITVAEIGANTSLKTAEMSGQPAKEQGGKVDQIAQAVAQLSELVTGAKVAKIERLRDPNGRMIGARRYLSNGEVEEIPIQ